MAFGSISASPAYPPISMPWRLLGDGGRSEKILILKAPSGTGNKYMRDKALSEDEVMRILEKTTRARLQL